MPMADLRDQFGQIDIYLFDQLLRSRIRRGMRILDAGCGDGRNLVYLLREGYDVFGADAIRSIENVRRLAAQLAPGLPGNNFRIEPVESMSFPNASMDVSISSAVLHFARSDEHFRDMLAGSWRPLKPGGLWFCRLASSIGIERQIQSHCGKTVPAARWLRALSGQLDAPEQVHGGTRRNLD